MSLGSNLFNARKKSGLTQETVAEKLNFAKSGLVKTMGRKISCFVFL